MENYIVRIYKRDPDDTDRVTGNLESVEQETRRPFNSLDDLRSMLDAPAGLNFQPTCADSEMDARRSPLIMPSMTRQRSDH